MNEAASPVRLTPWYRTRLAISLVLGLVTLLLFLPAMRFDFVDYDDADYVKANPHVLSGLSAGNVVWAFRTGHASNWHPLTWLSHMLDCDLFGQSPHGPHLVNALCHAANAILLFLVLVRMTGAFWQSALAAGIFALHPLRVESVAWISERKDVLSTLFFLLALWAYARYAARDEERTAKNDQVSLAAGKHHRPTDSEGSRTFRGGRRRINYLLALGFFALGLMSKPMLVTLPFILLLLDYWPLRRLQWQSPRLQRSQLKRLFLEKVPFFALCAASSVITFLVQRKGGAVSTSISVGARLANALVSYVRYLGKTLWPEHLSVLYPHPGEWPASVVLLSIAILLGISIGVAMVGGRKPYFLVGWLWFLGSLVPVIGLVQVGIQSMADRYTYVPGIGLSIMVVWGLAEALSERPGGRIALAAAAAAVLMVCTLLTSRQLRYWHDSEALFGHAVKVTDKNYLAYNNLGFFLSRKGELVKAMENYRKSLEINPNYEDALNNYGYALAGLKRYGEALGYYEAALRVRPDQVEVHNNLGNALSELGRVDEAIRHYLFVLQKKPDHADAHNNLGIALAMKGRLEEAIPHFREAIRLKPDYASAHSNLGNALAAQHKLEEAIVEYQESIHLKPDEAQAHNNLGNALAELGRLDQAIREYTEALRLNPDNPEAHHNVAMALSRQGRRDEAIAHLQQALRLRPQYPEARKALESLSGH